MRLTTDTKHSDGIRPVFIESRAIGADVRVTDAAGIRRLRLHLKEARRPFARRLGVTVRTVRSWEEGDRKCPTPVLILLKAITDKL